jgi:hypothetical protein
MRSADQLWSAALQLADRDSCARLRPFISASSALKQVTAQANGSPVARLRLLDEAFFALAEDMSEALLAKRGRLVSAADDAAAAVRRLGFLSHYEQRWRAIEPADEMRRPFMAVAEPLHTEMRGAMAPAIAAIAGRQRRLSFRRAVAADRARAMISPVADAAEGAVLRARQSFNHAVGAYLNDVARQHRQLTEQRHALEREGVSLPPPRVSPPAIVEHDWRLPDLSQVLRAAAADSVCRIGDRTADPLRYPARHVWLWRGYVLRARDVRCAAQAAWEAWLVTFSTALTAWLAQAWDLFVADYMVGRDGFVQTWRRHIADVADRAQTDLKRATARVTELDDAVDQLRQLCRQRDVWHTSDRAGLTPATRAALAEVRLGLGSGGLVAAGVGGTDSWLLNRLDALADEGEADVFVPVVATTKAGKSTVLGAMLGLDIAPHRTHPMTTVATRYVITDTVSDPELRLSENILADCARFRDRIRARITDDGADMAGYPHLGRFARQLLREPPSLAGYCCGAEVVRGTLTVLNDVTRVAITLLPVGELTSIVDWAPEVLVPARQHTDSRVTLVDTPALDEATGKELLASILDQSLRRADGCVLVINYAQLDTIATTALAALVAKRFGPRTGSAVWVVVNRIDQRQTARDPDRAGIRKTAGRLLGLSGMPVPVVETWAELALAAAVCKTPADPDRYGPVLALIDPHGGMADAGDPSRSLRAAIRKSGLEALRRCVLGDLRRRAAALTVDGVIDQLPTADLDHLRWALRSAGTAVAS